MKKLLTIVVIYVFSLSLPAQMPAFKFVKQFGATPNSQYPTSIATDALGNIYTTGVFSGTADFDPSSSTFNLTANGSVDLFVAKYDKDGLFIFAFNIGGSNNETDPKIKLDGAGNIIIVGGYKSNSVDFDPSAAINMAPNPVNTNYLNGFIAKYTSAGSFIWVKSINSNFDVNCNGMDVDVNDDIYIAGSFVGNCKFANSATTNTLSSTNSNEDAFLVKYDSNGNCQWQFQLGNNLDETANDISVNSIGEICITGKFRGTIDFDPSSSSTATITAPITSGAYDLFLAKYSTSGTYLWAKHMGPTQPGIVKINFDNNNDIIFVGSFSQSTIDFDPSANTYTLEANGNGVSKIFVSKYSNVGTFISVFEIASKQTFPNPNTNYIDAAEVDSNGDIFLMGVIQTTSTQSLICDFDPSAATSPTVESKTGQFIAKYSNNGAYQWVKAIPNVYAFCMNVDAGNVIIGGYSTGGNVYDFDLSSATYSISLGGATSSECYLAKYGNNTVGINDLNDINPTFSLYPNPTNSVINMESLVFNKNPTILYITNTLGQTILSKTITENNTQLNVSDFTKGIYFVILKSDNKISTQKLIIE